MKMLKSIICHLIRPTTLALLGLTLVTTASRAATITFETKVKGYSSAGWIQVKPELREKLGGRVAKIGGVWVTDRVQRGEDLRVSIRPIGRERCHNGSLSGVHAANGFFKWAAVSLPFVKTTKVSNDPSFDNVYVWTYTTSGYFEKRVPIGSHP
jgi:hypothetical protein